MPTQPIYYKNHHIDIQYYNKFFNKNLTKNLHNLTKFYTFAAENG